jgi:hypothetical protein
MGKPVIPRQVGIQAFGEQLWIPAFAGMTQRVDLLVSGETR